MFHIWWHIDGMLLPRDCIGLQKARIWPHMHYIAVYGVYNWLAGWPQGGPGIQRRHPGEGNEPIPGAHSYIQMAVARIQDTGYRIQDTRCILYARMQRMRDAGI